MSRSGSSRWIIYLAKDGVRATHDLRSQGGGFFGFPGGFSSIGTFIDDLDSDGVIEIGTGVGNAGVFSYEFFSIAHLLGITLDRTESSLVSDLGSAASIQADIRDLSGRRIDEVLISFRPAGESGLSIGRMERIENDLFTYDIASWQVDENGIEYFFEVTTEAGQRYVKPEDGLFSLRIRLPDGFDKPLPSGTAQSGYRLISIPLELEVPDARAVLEDDLGAYDPINWRFFDPEVVLRDIATGDIEIVPGKAYWILTREPGKRITTGPGTTTPTNEPFQKFLRTGWNFVANPFAFAIHPLNVRIKSGQAIDLRRYDGNWIPYDSSLIPFEGYIVWSNKVDFLIIDPDLASIPEIATKRSESGPEYAVRISARRGESLDTYNFAEIRWDADLSRDPFDRPSRPSLAITYP